MDNNRGENIVPNMQVTNEWQSECQRVSSVVFMYFFTKEISRSSSSKSKQQIAAQVAVRQQTWHLLFSLCSQNNARACKVCVCSTWVTLMGRCGRGSEVRGQGSGSGIYRLWYGVKTGPVEGAGGERELRFY